jgi:peptidoglycan/LPS O-acetylase OafA/YrhL
VTALERATAATAETGAGSGYRRDIQYLRALAVGLVVVYHFWSQRLPGGFVGVDVFFVISGYLITSHLVGGLARTGRLSLAGFWGRRIRRLLPASLTVLTVALAATLVWIPPSARAQALGEIVASVLYGQNWLLAADSVDYLAASNEPSLVQHFWSLSVEEQFYVVWPILLLLAWTVTTRVRRSRGVADPGRAARTAATVLAVVAVVSFVHSVVFTADDPSIAYFATSTRGWEFAVGGLVACAPLVARGPRGRAAHPAIRRGIALIGVALIVTTAVLIDGDAPFPGAVAAVPVLGTALAIWAGIGADAPRRPHRDPVEWIGDLSFSLYLWHWPVLIVAPFVLGRGLGLVDKLVLIAAAVGLAAVTKRFVEDPVRRARWLRRPLWRTFVAAGVAMALVVAAALVSTSALAAQAAEEAPDYSTAQIDAGIPCFGAGALAPGATCDDPFSSAGIDSEFVRTDKVAWCALRPDRAFEHCEVGATEDWRMTVAFVGDSHAAAMMEAVAAAAKASDIRVITYFSTGCPSISADRDVAAPGQPDDIVAACGVWSAESLNDIAERDDIDGVLFMNYSRRYADPAVADDHRLTTDVALTTITDLEAAGKRVAVLRDLPTSLAGEVPACLDRDPGADDPCPSPRAEAVFSPDPMVEAAAAAQAPLIDLSDFLCDADTCHTTIGGVATFTDESHVTQTFARSLVPFLTPLLAEAFAPGGP